MAGTQLKDDDEAGDHKKYLRGRLLLRRAFFASVLAFALVAAASGLVEEVYARKALWIPLAILAWLAMIGIGMFLRNAECPRSLRERARTGSVLWAQSFAVAGAALVGVVSLANWKALLIFGLPFLIALVGLWNVHNRKPAG